MPTTPGLGLKWNISLNGQTYISYDADSPNWDLRRDFDPVLYLHDDIYGQIRQEVTRDLAEMQGEKPDTFDLWLRLWA